MLSLIQSRRLVWRCVCSDQHTFSGAVPVWAAISFFRSPTVSSGLHFTRTIVSFRHAPFRPRRSFASTSIIRILVIWRRSATSGHIAAVFLYGGVYLKLQCSSRMGEQVPIFWQGEEKKLLNFIMERWWSSGFAYILENSRQRYGCNVHNFSVGPCVGIIWYEHDLSLAGSE